MNPIANLPRKINRWCLTKFWIVVLTGLLILIVFTANPNPLNVSFFYYCHQRIICLSPTSVYPRSSPLTPVYLRLPQFTSAYLHSLPFSSVHLHLSPSSYLLSLPFTYLGLPQTWLRSPTFTSVYLRSPTFACVVIVVIIEVRNYPCKWFPLGSCIQDVTKGID